MTPAVKRLLWVLAALVVVVSFAPSVVASSVGGALLVLAFLALVGVVIVRGLTGSRPGSGRGATRLADLASYRWGELGVGLVLGFAVGETFGGGVVASLVLTVVVAAAYRLLLSAGLSGIVLVVVGFVATVASLADLRSGDPCVPPGESGAVLLAVVIGTAAIVAIAGFGRWLFGLGGSPLGLRGIGDVRTAGLLPAMLLVVFSLIELTEFAFSPASADLLGADPWVKAAFALVAVVLAALVGANAELVLGLLGLGLTLSKGWLALVEFGMVTGAPSAQQAEYCLGGRAPLLCAAVAAIVVGVRRP